MNRLQGYSEISAAENIWPKQQNVLAELVQAETVMFNQCFSDDMFCHCVLRAHNFDKMGHRLLIYKVANAFYNYLLLYYFTAYTLLNILPCVQVLDIFKYFNILNLFNDYSFEMILSPIRKSLF